MKKTILSFNPSIYTYNNFLSDDECDHFINISKNSLQRALVSNDKGSIISKNRTGYNTWLKHNYDDITFNVAKRIAKIVNIPLENAELFQIIYYGISDEYKPHYDSWNHNYSKETLHCVKYGGARMKTALCYLNNVSKGGATRFNKLNINILPEKGKLLIFQNTISDNNHNIHRLSLHAGLPVIKGKKYAFNLWFRECSRDTLYKDFNPAYYSKKMNKY